MPSGLPHPRRSMQPQKPVVDETRQGPLTAHELEDWIVYWLDLDRPPIGPALLPTCKYILQGRSRVRGFTSSKRRGRCYPYRWPCGRCRACNVRGQVERALRVTAALLPPGPGKWDLHLARVHGEKAQETIRRYLDEQEVYGRPATYKWLLLPRKVRLYLSEVPFCSRIHRVESYPKEIHGPILFAIELAELAAQADLSKGWKKIGGRKKERLEPRDTRALGPHYPETTGNGRREALARRGIPFEWDGQRDGEPRNFDLWAVVAQGPEFLAHEMSVIQPPQWIIEEWLRLGHTKEQVQEAGFRVSTDSPAS